MVGRSTKGMSSKRAGQLAAQGMKQRKRLAAKKAGQRMSVRHKRK